MTILMDSYCWFEYFFGTEKGTTIRKLLAETDESVLISQVNLLEVYSKYLKTAPTEAEEKKAFMLARCNVADVDGEIALVAAKIKAEHGLGLADAIVLATARKNKCAVLTGDRHFEKFPDARIL